MPVVQQSEHGGYSGLDFPTVGAEIAYWLTHVTQAFKGGLPGSGENGYDFGLPHGTPVYAILPGKVVGAGYYGGGGVVSVQYNAQNVIYYQHLDLNQANVGDTVKAGQQIGLSGGQLSGGNHPATCCSGGDHIEVGINAPFGGIWNPQNVGGGSSTNPIGMLNSLLANYKNNDVSTGGTGSGISGLVGGLLGGGAANAGQQAGNAAGGFLQGLGLPQTVLNWITQPIRFLKLVGGILLLGVAAALVIIPAVAGPATMVAGAATGQPELVAAGSSISSMQRRAKRRDVAERAAKRVAKSRQPSQPVTPANVPEEKPEPVYASGKQIGTADKKTGKITFIGRRSPTGEAG